jgi:hypothetical protein
MPKSRELSTFVDGPRRDPAKMRPIALRNLGYNQGFSGKPPAESFRDNPVYMASYRRGKEAREHG